MTNPPDVRTDGIDGAAIYAALTGGGRSVGANGQ